MKLNESPCTNCTCACYSQQEVCVCVCLHSQQEVCLCLQSEQPNKRCFSSIHEESLRCSNLVLPEHDANQISLISLPGSNKDGSLAVSDHL